jgi:hypothetical protein
MVKKELDLSRSNRGTFFRSARKERDRAKWSHKSYKGWINLERSNGEVVVAEIRSQSQTDDEWQLCHAFIGWLDRHFSDKIQAINIQYRD